MALRVSGDWACHALESSSRSAPTRSAVQGLPDGFRFHDLRHFYASLLIHSGLDIKTVQARLGHASANTTLDVYGHMFPDSDETTRAAISSVMTTRGQIPAANWRPSQAVVKSLPLSEAQNAQTS
jgi:integrase